MARQPNLVEDHSSSLCWLYPRRLTRGRVAPIWPMMFFAIMFRPLNRLQRCVPAIYC
eukprot:SAG31_NODE_998_length_10460_cov_255.143505_1_plen_56_part_10